MLYINWKVEYKKNVLNNCLCLNRDQVIEYRKNEDGSKMTGKIIGIDENGFLQVKTDCGVISLHPDGNSFDILKGLIQPKQ